MCKPISISLLFPSFSQLIIHSIHAFHIDDIEIDEPLSVASSHDVKRGKLFVVFDLLSFFLFLFSFSLEVSKWNNTFIEYFVPQKGNQKGKSYFKVGLVIQSPDLELPKKLELNTERLR